LSVKKVVQPNVFNTAAFLSHVTKFSRIYSLTKPVGQRAVMSRIGFLERWSVSCSMDDIKFVTFNLHGLNQGLPMLYD